MTQKDHNNLTIPIPENSPIFTNINTSINMVTFTSSLPSDLLEDLNRIAAEQKLPKNKILEKSLKLYFEELEKQEYIASFKRLREDPEIIEIAEEGMADYMEQLKSYD